MSNPNYTIRRSTNNQYYWVLNSVNGRVLITSETYTTKDSCKGGIASSKICVHEANFNRRFSGTQFYFNQIANNYQVLGTSEMYNSRQAMEDGIAAVKRDAPFAVIIDLA